MMGSKEVPPPPVRWKEVVMEEMSQMGWMVVS